MALLKPVSGRVLAWALLCLSLGGCGACLADLSGTRCNPGGTCGPGYLCNASDVCILEGACDAGVCGARCTDLGSDPANCGVCGNVCPAGVACTQGSCACPRGLIACAAHCVDPSRDPLNCDACDDACPTEAPTCGRGRCLDASWTLWAMPASPGYAVTADISVDTMTGLSWQRQPDPTPLTQAAAGAACAALTLGGSTDWRLPSRIELISLLHPESSPALDGLAFPATQAAAYWSSSLAAQGSAEAWTVDFTDGNTAPLSTAASAFTRCVR